MAEVRAQSLKDHFLGPQFIATVIARCHGNDVDFMPLQVPEKLIPLDNLEPWFKSMAEGDSKQSPKRHAESQELGD